MALNADVGSASANSFVTRSEANAYFADRAYEADSGYWAKDQTGAARSDAVKDAALVTASRRINEERFVGRKTTTTQALKFPRYDTFDDDGNTYASDAIPQPVKEATFMMALEILKVDLLAENHLSNYSFLQTATSSFKQFSPAVSGRLPASVRRLLRGLLDNYGPSIGLVRG